MCGVDAHRALGKGFPEDSSAPGLRKHVQRWDGRWGTPSRAAMSAPQNMVPSHGGAAAAPTLGARFGAFMAQGSVGLTPCQEWIRGLLVKA